VTRTDIIHRAWLRSEQEYLDYHGSHTCLVDLRGSRTPAPAPWTIAEDEPAKAELVDPLLGLKAPGKPSMKLGILPFSAPDMNGFFFDTWSMIDPAPVPEVEVLSLDFVGATAVPAAAGMVDCKALVSSRAASA
jgi:hypothetical protein